ncbi:MAG: methyl-accepting chemotaxis protein [Desulfobacter sp.]|nr:MAG: methyl-accepting chemotaxis protein [Desulfobacter sp.]
MTFFKNLSIKYKLFFAYAAVSLVVFSISFALLFFQVRNSIESRIQEALSKSNQAITDLVETAATISIKNHLQDIAENNLKIITHLFQSSLKGQIPVSQAKNKAEKILLSQTIGKTGYIYCVDSLGTLQVHPQKRIQGKNIAVNTFIQDQTKKKSGYLEYHWKNPGETTERAKALYMVYFEPWDWIVSVSSYRAEFAQLVSIEDFKDKVLDRTFGKTGYSFIFDIQGNMVIHPELSGNFFDLRQTRGKRILQEMIDKKHGYLTYFWKNPSEALAREKFVAFDHIPDFDWIIASSSYTAEVFSPLSEMRATFLIIFALTLSFIGCVSMILSDSITQPLTAFIKRFEKGAEGDLTSKMKTVRQDEIGQLSSSFNLFMDRIKAYQNGISLEIKTRKKTEKQLQTLRNDLADIIDSMPSMLIGVDKKMQVTLWNKKTAN